MWIIIVSRSTNTTRIIETEELVLYGDVEERLRKAGVSYHI